MGERKTRKVGGTPAYGASSRLKRDRGNRDMGPTFGTGTEAMFISPVEDRVTLILRGFP